MSATSGDEIVPSPEGTWRTLAFYLVFIVLIRGTFAVWRALRSRKRCGDDPLPAPPAWPPVSIVVPAWLERGTIEICIACIKALDYPFWDAVIVAGGLDGTLEAARVACGDDPRFRVVEQQPHGKSVALNDGVAVSGGTVVVFLDADSRFGPEWLRAMVAPLLRGAAASTGRYLPLRRTWVSQQGEIDSAVWYCLRGENTLQGSGGIAITRAALEAAGPFLERSMADDWELDARLALRGLQRRYAWQALIHTERPATIGEWWRNEVRWRRIHLRAFANVRPYFLGNPIRAARYLHTYVMAWLCILLPAGALLAGRGNAESLRRRRFLPAFLLYEWLLVNRVLMPLSLTIQSRRRDWLASVWIPPVMMVLSFAASIVASLTVHRTPAQFKGPRPMREQIATD